MTLNPRTSPSHSPEHLLSPDVCPVLGELFCFQEAWCWVGIWYKASHWFLWKKDCVPSPPPTAPLSFLPWGKPLKTQILVSALLLIQVVTSDNLSIFMLWRETVEWLTCRCKSPWARKALHSLGSALGKRGMVLAYWWDPMWCCTWKCLETAKDREVVLDSVGVHRAWGSQQPGQGSYGEVLDEKQEVAARS